MRTMRRCARSEELRAALAAEEPLTEALTVHARACAECAEIRASARRFEERIDRATAEVVTDALPETTLSVARMAPRPGRRRPSPPLVLSAVATIVVVAFASIGVASTAVSISNAVSGFGTGPDPTAADGEQVDCYVGEPIVEVTVETVGVVGTDRAIAYCIGAFDRVASERRAAVECVRSIAITAAQGRTEPSQGSTQRLGDLGACEYVEEAGADDGPGAVATPFGSWHEAAAATNWPVFRTGWLPDGFELAALQGFAPETDRASIESVAATYLRGGVPLTLDQFVIDDPSAFRIELTISGDDLDIVTTGRTTVGPHPAFWASGPIASTRTGYGGSVENLVLTWTDDGVGYRITSWTEDLETVRRLAESLGED
jgi:hypothetical protein